MEVKMEVKMKLDECKKEWVTVISHEGDPKIGV